MTSQEQSELDAIYEPAIDKITSAAMRGDIEAVNRYAAEAKKKLLAWRTKAIAEAEQRGRDAQILELVNGYDGLLADLTKIQSGAKSLGIKASALVTRLSAVRPTPRDKENT